MMDNMNVINLDDTRFIFSTNFSGDPEKDRYGDVRRKVNIIIPDPAIAEKLVKNGIKVRVTRPRPEEDTDDYEPNYFVTALLKYRTRNGSTVKYPPKVYLVSGDNEPLLLDEDSVAQLDNIRIKNVNAVLSPYNYGPNEKDISLYIRTMYVEQDLDDDPYAERYRSRRLLNNEKPLNPYDV